MQNVNIPSVIWANVVVQVGQPLLNNWSKKMFALQKKNTIGNN
jgi:hypothetical protein